MGKDEALQRLPPDDLPEASRLRTMLAPADYGHDHPVKFVRLCPSPPVPHLAMQTKFVLAKAETITTKSRRRMRCQVIPQERSDEDST